jgi:hypothetical protein
METNLGNISETDQAEEEIAAKMASADLDAAAIKIQAVARGKNERRKNEERRCKAQQSQASEAEIGQLLMEGAQLLELLGQEDVEDVSLLVQRPASPIARALYDRLAEHAAVGMESSDIIRLQSEVPSVSRALHDVQELLKEGRNLMERVALQVLSLLSLRVQKYTY